MSLGLNKLVRNTTTVWHQVLSKKHGRTMRLTEPMSIWRPSVFWDPFQRISNKNLKQFTQKSCVWTYSECIVYKMLTINLRPQCVHGPLYPVQYILFPSKASNLHTGRPEANLPGCITCLERRWPASGAFAVYWILYITPPLDFQTNAIGQRNFKTIERCYHTIW